MPALRMYVDGGVIEQNEGVYYSVGASDNGKFDIWAYRQVDRQHYKSTDAEYLAIITGLTLLNTKNIEAGVVMVLTDCKAVAEHYNSKKSKQKNKGMQSWYDKTLNIVGQLKKKGWMVNINWVPRDEIFKRLQH